MLQSGSLGARVTLGFRVRNQTHGCIASFPVNSPHRFTIEKTALQITFLVLMY